METRWTRRENLHRSRITTQHKVAFNEVAQGAGSDTRAYSDAQFKATRQVCALLAPGEAQSRRSNPYPNGYPQHDRDSPEEWEFDPADETAVMEALRMMGFNAHDIAAAAGTDERRTYEEEQEHEKTLKGSHSER